MDAGIQPSGALTCGTGYLLSPAFSQICISRCRVVFMLSAHPGVCRTQLRSEAKVLGIHGLPMGGIACGEIPVTIGELDWQFLVGGLAYAGGVAIREACAVNVGQVH